METINNKLPATVGINNVVKGVYEFDVDILHTEVVGFGGTYHMTYQAMTNGKQKLFLRIGNTYMPESYRRGTHIPEFVLGDFTKVWMDDRTVKGTVVIRPCHYALFDEIVDVLGGVMVLGVCSMAENIGHGRGSTRIIQNFFGAQILDPVGYSLMDPPSDDAHEIHHIGLKSMPGTAEYIQFCAKSIAEEPYVPPVKQEQPSPPLYGAEMVPTLKVMEPQSLAEFVAKEKAAPHVPCQGAVIADTHVKGLDEKIAELATSDPIESLCLDKEIKLEAENGA